MAGVYFGAVSLVLVLFVPILLPVLLLLVGLLATTRSTRTFVIGFAGALLATGVYAAAYSAVDAILTP